MNLRRSRLIASVVLAGVLFCCFGVNLLLPSGSYHLVTTSFDSHLANISHVNGDSINGGTLSANASFKNLLVCASCRHANSTASKGSHDVSPEATVDTTTAEPIRVQQIRNLYDSEMIVGQGIKLKWIRNRMIAMANTWDQAVQNLSLYKPLLFMEQKSILVLPGLLSDKLCPHCRFAEDALKGGPVGELVQWTDLIVSLFLLGHKITIVTTPQRLEAIKDMEYDIIMTDYIGLLGLHQNDILARHKCRTRVLDTFGSEPLEIFNATGYNPNNTYPYFSRWQFKNTKQFWNLYPHTPDNSFLGFAMEIPEQVHTGARKDMALIYGKKENYMVGMERYLASIGQSLKLHSTFTTYLHKLRGADIVNHGVVDHTTLSGLLQSSKLFIGLGFPYEGPGPLEALANGCPYVQPRFSPPRGRLNEEFFRLKPTTRTVTSQSPYVEDYVGEPYVYTVDANDLSAVKEVVDKVISRGDLPPYIPYEFTQQGMMDRVGTYIKYQDFCRGKNLIHSATALSSSYRANHPAGQAIDVDPKGETCYQSEVSSQPWWEADLGSDQFITEIFITLKITEHLSKRSLLVSLRDSAGFNRTNDLIMEHGLSLNWTNIQTMARHVRIVMTSSVADQLILCAVDIFGTSSIWPKPSLLKVLHSNDDESCTSTCARHQMMCEYSFFPLVNTFKALSEGFKCDSLTETRKYMSVFPSYIQSGDNGFVAGSCVTTKISELLSCSGHHHGYLRLCPCRHYRKGQVALPVEL